MPKTLAQELRPAKRPVYAVWGKFKKRFPSMTAAARWTGNGKRAGNISEAVSRGGIRYGFFWTLDPSAPQNARVAPCGRRVNARYLYAAKQRMEMNPEPVLPVPVAPKEPTAICPCCGTEFPLSESGDTGI